MPMIAMATFWLGSVACAAVGAYFGSYLKKKGENLATQEDLNKLVDQLKATTEATKRIEAQISGEMWDKQKQWELTRDAALRLMEAQARLEDAGDEVVRVQGRMSRHNLFDPPSYTEAEEVLERWRNARRAMIDVLAFLSFACWTKETSNALSEFLSALQEFRDTPKEDLGHQIVSKATWLVFSFDKLRSAVRGELRLRDKEVLSWFPMIPSDEISAPPTSD